MTETILDIADAPVALSVRYDQLVIQPENGEPATRPLEEMAALVLAHPRSTVSQAALAGLAKAGAAFVVCGDNYLPAGMLLPLDANSVQTERISLQACLPIPRRKQLWRQVVQAKIRAQARLLVRLRGHDAGLPAVAAKVRSGDTLNAEAQAARRYWDALFDSEAFRRRREEDDQNRFLNYGYAVLRAIVARAVCAAGLHPSIGLHHCNRYNAFCLADDLMEPFRPIADHAAVALWQEAGPDAPLDRPAKQRILSSLYQRFDFEGEQRTLFDILSRVAASLVAVIYGRETKLRIPEI